MNTLINKTKEQINPYVDWFKNTIGKEVQDACQEFWEDKYDFLLTSITESPIIKNDYATKNEFFFTKKFKKEQNQLVSVRLSSNFARVFLHIYLSSSEPKFNLMELSDLEAKILNSFAQFVYDKIKIHFVDYNTLSKQKKNIKGNYNLTFAIRKPKYPSGKISISIPKNLVSPLELKTIENFTLQDFLMSPTTVNLKVGTTKITLNELKSLNKEDILFLENSNINRMKIKTQKVETEFKINPNPSLIIDLNEKEHGNIEGETMTKNVWDDIQIEVSAEFNKVKMTLGELKQLTSGMIVDLGDIFDNKISLVVEEKTVAKGELVIINDKYGVKIDEIISDGNVPDEDDVIKTNIKTNQNYQNEEKNTPKKDILNDPQAIEEDEDFDYSNFEDEGE